jgi:hypothetical protein
VAVPIVHFSLASQNLRRKISRSLKTQVMLGILPLHITKYLRDISWEFTVMLCLTAKTLHPKNGEPGIKLLKCNCTKAGVKTDYHEFFCSGQMWKRFAGEEWLPEFLLPKQYVLLWFNLTRQHIEKIMKNSSDS